MKLHDTRIATQLRLGLGIIMALVISFGVFAWRQTHQIWLNTQTMYQSPMQVHGAINTLEFDIMAMRLEFRNLLLAKDDAERQTSLQNSDVYETDAKRQFLRLHALYLGPSTDVDEAENAFVRWSTMSESNRVLGQSGKVNEAMNRIAEAGDIGMHRKQLLDRIQKIDANARSKADQLYLNASEQSDTMKVRLALTVTLTLLVTMIIGGLLLRAIRVPLKDLMTATEQFRRGHLEVRSQYTSNNEFGVLSAAFNTMAAEIQIQTQVNENEAHLAKMMLQEDEVHGFCRELLKGLLQHTGSQVGAIYFQNEAKSAFVHFESIGLGAGGRATFSTTELEGELGAVLATRQIQRITEIPPETRFTFTAVSGNFSPREILTIPVLSGNSVVAVISLASLHAYNEPAMRLVNDLWSVLTARVNGVLAFRKIHYIAEQLEQKNHELESQQRALADQALELTSQNTELEMQKQQLHESNRLKSAFLSNMSHELRTPLNSVIALSGVLNRRLANAIPTEEYGYLEVIERNGRNLLELINNILDLSRIEAGHEDLHPGRFMVRDWVAEIVAMIEPLAREKNIALLNLVGDDLPPIHSDYDKCRHILQNLVGNALKFTDAGSVEISALAAHGELQLTVRDTGIGIDPNQLPHIFDEFRQADDSTSRKYGGTGLGLAIAKKYALLLGGSISVESTPGQGSCFTLRLPLNADRLASPRYSEPSGVMPTAAATPSGHGQTILVVEDNDPIIVQLTDILQAQGYQIQVAHDGREALDCLDRCVPDAMILDLMMPEVDGFQVLKTIRSKVRTAQVPVLILTAKHVTREELSTLTGNHIHQLIQKGDIHKDELLAAVARMVARPEPATTTPTPTPTPTTPPNRRRPTRPGQPRVLVVEDNPDNMRTARALLDDHYQVITAVDGRAGIDQAKLHQPDLILTDISIPVMDGFMVLAAIRGDSTLHDVPVIAVTASAMKGNREEILAHGFDDYISKPIDHEILMRILHGLLARKPDA